MSQRFAVDAVESFFEIDVIDYEGCLEFLARLYDVAESLCNITLQHHSAYQCYCNLSFDSYNQGVIIHHEKKKIYTYIYIYIYTPTYTQKYGCSFPRKSVFLRLDAPKSYTQGL